MKSPGFSIFSLTLPMRAVKGTMYVQKRIIQKASEYRLSRLIEKRVQNPSIRDEIDKRIWDLFGETWSIVFTDMVGFSRSVAKFGIVQFLEMIYHSHQLFLPVIDEFDGILIKEHADSLMILYRKPKNAVESLREMNRKTKVYNENNDDLEKIHLCAGVGFGRILKIDSTDVFGAEVNAASKLGEDTAKAGQILVTSAVYDSLHDQYSFEKIDYVPPGSDAAYLLKE